MKAYITPNTEYIFIGAMRELMGFDDESGGGSATNPQEKPNPGMGLAPQRKVF